MSLKHTAHTIETYTGRVVDLARPEPATIDLTDIVTGLSRTARFGGHTRAPYSVAEHSVLVAEIARRLVPSAGPLLLRQALLHDAAEAYLGDVVRPLKLIAEVARTWEWLEAQMERAIAQALDVPRPMGDEARAIAEADTLALAIEALALMPSGGADWDLPEVPPGLSDLYVEAHDPDQAALQWLFAWQAAEQRPTAAGA